MRIETCKVLTDSDMQRNLIHWPIDASHEDRLIGSKTKLV